jgi:sterol desaturase/sphingolipid hydroxylase (fatty acid hydroxylase superfamily)
MHGIITWLMQWLLSDSVLLMALMFALIGVIELFAPAQKIPLRHYAFNARFGVLTAFVTALLALPISAGVAVALQAVGFGLIDLRALGFDGVGGGIVSVLVSAFIFDFLFYWMHRLEHRNPILWQQHLVHHCDEYMNVTSAARNHFVEAFLLPIFVTIPMAVLFKLPPVTIGMLSLVPIAWLYVQHANIRLSFGPLWWLLVSPDYHRIHHSLTPQHIDKNLVLWFPIWDILFGTAWRPRPEENPACGVAGVNVKTLPQAYLLPFKGWNAMIRSRRPTVEAPQRVAGRRPRSRPRRATESARRSARS